VRLVAAGLVALLALSLAGCAEPSRPAVREPSVAPSRPNGTAATVPPPPLSLRGRVVTAIPTARRIVALTFDGGSGAQAVTSVLATLRRERVPASTFLTGDFLRGHPTEAKALAAARLRFGNHSDTHPYFTQITDAQATDQIGAAHRAALSVTGQETKPLFRFPYGAYDRSDIGLVNRLGYVPVGWTVDTLGWKGAEEGITIRQVVARVLDQLRPGAIVLMHLGASPDGSTLDADALPAVIEAIRQRGYDFVTLDALGR
jgi:peptidoglycan/xylan/chitin deacetylase (PgdA/CDA1 family)